MRIGLDIMGGDYAPKQIVLGAILAYKELKQDYRIALLGPKAIILEQLQYHGANSSWFDIVDSPQIIEMGDKPVKAFVGKPHSSIVQGFNMLSLGKLDGFASAGNTGAMLVGAMQVSKTIKGVIRPCISSLYPKSNGEYNLLLDVGLSPESKPENLTQFAVIGSIYARLINKIKHPKVGLLNLGSEEGKGTETLKSTFELLKKNKNIKFIGNIEGSDLSGNKADVIITNGYTGNVIIKQAEWFFQTMKSRGINDEYWKGFNYELYGGTPILGINHTVIIGHGVSNALAIKNMILQTISIAESEISSNIKKILNNE